jgi:hypothetical protein
MLHVQEEASVLSLLLAKNAAGVLGIISAFLWPCLYPLFHCVSAVECKNPTKRLTFLLRLLTTATYAASFLN